VRDSRAWNDELESSYRILFRDNPSNNKQAR